MTPNPESVQPETSALDIVRTLMEHTFRSVSVLGADGRVLGVVSDEDLITRAGLPVRPALMARLGTDLDEMPEIAPLKQLRARDLMTSPAVTVAADAFLQEAVRKMLDSQHRTLPVVDGAGQLVGMLSRLDILRAAGHWSRAWEHWNGLRLTVHDPATVREAITGQDRSVAPDATLLDVAQMIVASGIRRVAVVDNAGQLKGIVAEADLIRALQPGRASFWGTLVRWLSGASTDQVHGNLHRSAESLTAAEVMTRDTVVALADEPLSEAIQRMVSAGLKELPVTDADGRFIGFLSRRALLKAIAGAANASASGQE